MHKALLLILTSALFQSTCAFRHIIAEFSNSNCTGAPDYAVHMDSGGIGPKCASSTAFQDDSSLTEADKEQFGKCVPSGQKSQKVMCVKDFSTLFQSSTNFVEYSTSLKSADKCPVGDEHASRIYVRTNTCTKPLYSEQYGISTCEGYKACTDLECKNCAAEFTHSDNACIQHPALKSYGSASSSSSTGPLTLITCGVNGAQVAKLSLSVGLMMMLTVVAMIF